MFKVSERRKTRAKKKLFVYISVLCFIIWINNKILQIKTQQRKIFFLWSSFICFIFILLSIFPFFLLFYTIIVVHFPCILLFFRLDVPVRRVFKQNWTETQRKHVQSITCPIIITIFLWYTIFSSCLTSGCVCVCVFLTIFLFIYAQGTEKWFGECDDNNIFTSTFFYPSSLSPIY